MPGIPPRAMESLSAAAGSKPACAGLAGLSVIPAWHCVMLPFGWDSLQHLKRLNVGSSTLCAGPPVATPRLSTLATVLFHRQPCMLTCRFVRGVSLYTRSYSQCLALLHKRGLILPRLLGHVSTQMTFSRRRGHSHEACTEKTLCGKPAPQDNFRCAKWGNLLQPSRARHKLTGERACSPRRMPWTLLLQPLRARMLIHAASTVGQEYTCHHHVCFHERSCNKVLTVQGSCTPHLRPVHWTSQSSWRAVPGSADCTRRHMAILAKR